VVPKGWKTIKNGKKSLFLIDSKWGKKRRLMEWGQYHVVARTDWGKIRHPQKKRGTGGKIKSTKTKRRENNG